MKAKDHGQSDEQREFEAECTRAGWTYVLGDLNALVAFLIAGGWLRRQDVAWYRLPPTPSCTCGSSAAAPCAVHGGVTIPKPSTTAGD
jgi:hypothetical protein